MEEEQNMLNILPCKALQRESWQAHSGTAGPGKAYDENARDGLRCLVKQAAWVVHD